MDLTNGIALPPQLAPGAMAIQAPVLGPVDLSGQSGPPMLPAPTMPNVIPGPSLRDQVKDAQALQLRLDAIPAPSLGQLDMSGTPTFSAPISPSVTMNRHVASSSNSGDSQLYRDQDTLNNFRTTGSGVDQIQNPLLRGIARVGDVLGSVFAPGLASAIPGTTLHHNLLVNQATQNMTQDQKFAQQDAQTAETHANTANLDLQPQLKEQAAALAQSKQAALVQHQQAALDQTRQLQLARNGQMETTGVDGTKQIVDDPSSQVYQGRAALADYHNAQVGLDQANTALKLAANDPNSPAYQLAAARQRTAQANASAASERASAYMGNYLQHSRNVDLAGNVLPGAPQIEDNNGNVTTVGSTNAGQAVKAQANVAQFNDVHGALDNLEQNARQLTASGGSLNSPSIIYAMQHASGTPSQFVQSLDKANLTPQERSYVLSVQAAHENIQALRKSAGGTSTDSAVDKLDQLIPNGTTPNLDYLLGQTSQIRQTAERLGKGVTTVKGGAGVRGENANNTAPMIRAVDPQGNLHEAPAGTPLPKGWKSQ
jgi:hypothetical protein